MKMIRAIANTINDKTFIASMRYPATENDKNDMIVNASKWFNNPVYNNWRVELCNCDMIDDEPSNIEIIQTWNIDL